jgi:hypothetical protein
MIWFDLVLYAFLIRVALSLFNTYWITVHCRHFTPKMRTILMSFVLLNLVRRLILLLTLTFVCTLNVTNKVMVCFVVIQERCWIILIWRRPNDRTYRRGRHFTPKMRTILMSFVLLNLVRRLILLLLIYKR